MLCNCDRHLELFLSAACSPRTRRCRLEKSSFLLMLWCCSASIMEKSKALPRPSAVSRQRLGFDVRFDGWSGASDTLNQTKTSHHNNLTAGGFSFWLRCLFWILTYFDKVKRVPGVADVAAPPLPLSLKWCVGSTFSTPENCRLFNTDNVSVGNQEKGCCFGCHGNRTSR